MSEVLFASSKVKRMAAEATLPAKFDRMLKKINFETCFKDRTVAVKMHVGHRIGYTTIPPIFVKMVIHAIKQAGGYPFITDGSFSVGGAAIRGYTEEILGVPIRPAAGVLDKYFYTRPVNYRSLKSVDICGNIADAEAMLVLSHGKGHGQCGFGGAIKNIAMGCVTVNTRAAIHGLMDTAFSWNREACVHCYLCRDNCPGGAVRFDENGNFSIMTHNCRYCMHCVDSCPEHAISIDLSGIRYFQEGMARTVKAVLDTFQPKRLYYITALMDITPFCDCWGFSTPSLVPDVGIMASDDIVSIEQASLDVIDYRNYIPGTLPEQLEMAGEGHLFQRIHRKDPYLQVETAAEMCLGEREYRLVETE
jgi:uncharacterized Fe-S center protein